MKFKIDIIIDILSNKIEKSLISHPMKTYTEIIPLSKEDLLPNTIYIGLASEINSPHLQDNLAFILIGTPKYLPPNAIILSAENNLLQVYSFIIKKLQELQELELNLTKAIYNGTYQEMLKIAYGYLKNPLVLLDIGCRSLGVYPHKSLPGDDEWNYVIENGFFSLESTKKMKSFGNFDIMDSFDTPDFFTSNLFPSRSIVANIKQKDSIIARVIIPEPYHSFNKIDLFAAQLLSDALKLKFSNDKDFTPIQKDNPVYLMFFQLLSGISLDKSLIEDRIQSLSGWNNDFYRILAVPLGDNAEQLYYYFANSLQKIGYTILFENSSVTFLHYSSPKDFEDIKVLISNFISDADLVGCLSNEFNSLSDSFQYFKQAKVLYSFINNSKTLYCYDEYALNHLLSFYKNENKKLLCHPALSILREYDLKNCTEFFRTLQVYLENERSLIKASTILYIHRNTLLYRLDKIYSVLNIDFEDFDTRLHLLISYKLF